MVVMTKLQEALVALEVTDQFVFDTKTGLLSLYDNFQVDDMDEYEEKIFLKDDFHKFIELAREYVPNAIKLRECLPPFHFGDRPKTSMNQKKTVYQVFKGPTYEDSDLSSNLSSSDMSSSDIS
jgi:hypothetical protein